MGKLKDNKLLVLLVIINVIVIFLMIITFNYGDCRSLAAWSINILDLLSEGNLNDFYIYTAQNLRGAVHPQCAGHFLGLIPIAIWNIPIWLIYYLSGIVTEITPLCIIWTKLFYVFLSGILVYYIYKICLSLNSNKKYIAYSIALIFGSSELLLSNVYAGQDEIVYVTLFFIALYYFIKNKEWLFILFGTLTITLCPLMLVPYIGLILIKNKNLLAILSRLAITQLPVLLFNIIYSSDTTYKFFIANNSSESFINTYLTGSRIQNGFGDVYIIVGILIFIYFKCYYLNIEKDKKGIQYVLYYLSSIMLVIGCMAWDQYYRAFLWLPFLVMLIITYQTINFRINIFLVVLLDIIRTLHTCYINSYIVMNTFEVMKTDTLKQICNFFDSTNYMINRGLVNEMINVAPGLQLVFNLLNTLAVAIAILLLYINKPDEKKDYSTFCFSEKQTITVYILFMPALLVLFYFLLFNIF